MSERRLLNTAELAVARSLGIPRGCFVYHICWPAGYVSALDKPDKKATLIHELSHVWQGANGAWPTFYMGQSIIDQLETGIKDIWKTKKWRGWGNHRAGAHTIAASDFGRPWSSFGVEQQAGSSKAGISMSASGAATMISVQVSSAAAWANMMRAFLCS